MREKIDYAIEKGYDEVRRNIVHHGDAALN